MGLHQRTKDGKRYHVVRYDYTKQHPREAWFRCTGKSDPCRRCTGLTAAKDFDPIPPAAGDTISALADIYLDQHVEPHCAQRTLRAVKGDIELRIRPLLGDRRPDDLKPLDIQAFLVTLTSNGASHALANRSLRVLKSMLRKGVEWGEIETNPAAVIRRLPVDEPPPPKSLTPLELKRLGEACRTLRDRAIVLTAAYGGPRRSELAALRQGDANLEERSLTISRSLDQDRSMKATKSGKHRTAVLIGSPVREALQEWLDVAPRTELLFPSKTGRPLPDTWFSREWPQIRTRAQLPDVTFHQLRKTYGSLLIASGATAFEVKASMGHESISTTYKHYAGELEGSGQGLAERGDALVAAQLERKPRRR